MDHSQDNDFNSMESRIARLEEELQSRRLAEEQAKEKLHNIETINAQYRADLQEMQLKIEEQRKQQQKELQNAESAFREQLLATRATGEKERNRKEDERKAVIADLHNRLNEKTKNELLQEESLRNFKKRATNVRGRLIMKKFTDERQGRLEVREARKENDKIRQMLRDEEEKSSYLRKQLRLLKREGGDQ